MASSVFTIRIKDEDLAQIQTIGNIEQKSVNSLIIQAIREYVENHSSSPLDFI
jgi:predicted HicB family RNase H-like nuclease